MQVDLRPRSSTALASLILYGGGALAQGSPSGWLDLVQMPVAVARLELAGVSVADLEAMVSALDVQDVAPGRFLASVRGLPMLGTLDPGGLGGYLRGLHARGLRGASLADAVELELRSRGIPAGPRHRLFSGHDVLHPDFVPPGLRPGMRDERSGLRR